jgi:membrane-associated protease RseP (regulator of RpoE activity)
MTDTSLWVLVIAGIIAAVLLHEAAHFLAARAVGGRDVRVHLIGLSPKVSAELPPGRMSNAMFFASGPLANLTAAAMLVAMSTPTTVVLGALQGLLGVVNLLPLPNADGLRLWRLFRRR